MRIITGKAKGLKLKTPAGMNTRPTSDRIKESLFSVLGGMIDFNECEKVLDIFAGTGALGLEAVSRGAESAFFADNFTADLIRENIKRAKFEENCKVFRGDFEKSLSNFAGAGEVFDLIFCDPPYNKGLSQKTLDFVSEKNLLTENGLLIVETGAEEFLDEPKNLKCIRRMTYGKTTGIRIYERGNWE